jgi:hypothetical protein
MAAYEQQLILYMLGSLAVQMLQELVEALPLGTFAIRLLVSLVGLVDQTKVGCSLEDM